MKQTLTLNMGGVTRNQLQAFLDAAPVEAEFTTIVGWSGVDRPGDVDRATVELQAEWES